MTERSNWDREGMVKVPLGIDGDGLRTWDLTRANSGGRNSPFVVAALFDMWGPFFPPHPHAGVSVATYILPESEIGFWNQDSLGLRNRIAPGAMHLTVAGRGIQHEETPERSGLHARGFQIWIDHDEAEREAEPRGEHRDAENLPIVRAGDAEGRLLLGRFGGEASPLMTPTHATVVDFTLPARGALCYQLEASEQAFVWFTKGTSGQAVSGGVSSPSVRFFPRGGRIELDAGEDEVRLMLFAGVPTSGPFVPSGTFVASSGAQALDFRKRYMDGRMGRLRPFNQAALDRDYDARTDRANADGFDAVDEADAESFPSSDPPSWTLGTSRD